MPQRANCIGENLTAYWPSLEAESSTEIFLYYSTKLHVITSLEAPIIIIIIIHLLRMEAAGSSETLFMYQTTRRHISGDCNLNITAV
jgi:hypothetical protein